MHVQFVEITIPNAQDATVRIPIGGSVSEVAQICSLMWCGEHNGPHIAALEDAIEFALATRCPEIAVADIPYTLKLKFYA